MGRVRKATARPPKPHAWTRGSISRPQIHLDRPDPQKVLAVKVNPRCESWCNREGWWGYTTPADSRWGEDLRGGGWGGQGSRDEGVGLGFEGWGLVGVYLDANHGSLMPTTDGGSTLMLATDGVSTLMPTTDP